jgi:N-acetylmuramoyl-L-alanine amidase
MMKCCSFKAIIIFILNVIFSGYCYSNEPTSKNEKTMVVVIDPGHGGKDPGAVSKGGVREKDVVLAIGKKLSQFINEGYPDVKVIFTRSSDVFVPLIDRSRIANKNKADLFISLHANICGTPSIRGTETFCLGVARLAENLDVAKKENSVIKLEDDYSITYEGFDPDSDVSNIMFEMAQETYLNQSLFFADAIQHQLRNNLETSDRGVKQAGFLVLRLSAMPSVLIETGFISNQAEARYLSSEEGQRNIAVSVFEAFKRFKTKNSGSQSTVDKQPLAANQPNSDHLKQEQVVSTKVTENSEANNIPEKQSLAPEKLQTEVPKTIENSQGTTASQPVVSTQSPEIKPQESSIQDKATGENNYYSVQIGANITPLDPVPANFKGLKGIRREKTDKYYRYYIGKELSMSDITPIWQQIKLKFPQAFIVSFTDGKRVIIESSIKP